MDVSLNLNTPVWGTTSTCWTKQINSEVYYVKRFSQSQTLIAMSISRINEQRTTEKDGSLFSTQVSGRVNEQTQTKSLTELIV